MIEKVKHRSFYTRALEIFMEEYRQNLEEKGEFSVAFSGGNTPKPLFGMIAREDVDWSRVHVFIVDERYLPPDHKDSNYNHLYEELLSKVDIPPKNVRYVKHMESLEMSRLEYQYEVEKFFREKGEGFDLILLGMGIDGHTASLFPDNIHMEDLVVPSLEGDTHKYSRISMGIECINKCRKKVFLLGKNKKEVLEELGHIRYPAAYVKGDVRFVLEV